MIKLLVNEPWGEQSIREIHESGSYFDPERVLWDERIHGPMFDEHKAKVGWLKRDGKRLVEDTELKILFDAKVAAAEAVKYKEERAKAYPPLDEVTHALIEEFQEMYDAGADFGASLTAILEKRKQVKERYPKGG